MKIVTALTAALLVATLTTAAQAGPRDDIVQSFMAQGAASGDAARGQKLFTTKFGLGKPETPSCTTCHGATPFTSGETRTGKVIEPMAVSKTPARYTDPKKVAKWFRRNCNSVLGRECTAQEKVDFITYMSGQ
ncbi:DUF1924 domain-containing protein [Magnetovibrio sp. PR-2]|uniref:DUF1924 domain-containing protein n=1 Tax=Magnetovibrio sp. PR-2 TaxID=3120356 RepID=UPI002FCE17BA